MYLSFVLLLIFSFLTFPSLAGEKPLPKKGIVTIIRTYADSVGCFVHMNPDNILRYDFDKSWDEVVVVYDIDEDCSGGSQTSRPAFAVLRKDYSHKFHVVPKLSIPTATSEKFPRFIESISIKDNELWYFGHELGPNDSLCCPSIPVNAKIILKDGLWLDGRDNVKSGP